MTTLPAPIELATQRPHAATPFLVQIDFTAPTPKTLRVADRHLEALGHEWLHLVDNYGNLEELLNTLDSDGRPATAELDLINTKPVEGRSRLSDLIRTPLNTLNSWEWAFARVTISQLFEGLGAVRLGVFFLEDPTEIGEERLRVRMSDQSLVLEDQLAITRITKEGFPQASRAVIDKRIPRAIGVLRTVLGIPFVDGDVAHLAGAVTATATTFTLDDVGDLSDVGTGQIDVEQFTWTTRNIGTKQLGGITRGVNGTTAVAHTDQAAVMQLRSGANAYQYVVCEHDAAFKTKAITHIRVNGQPPRTAPSALLDVVASNGKRYAVIAFTPSNMKAFHTIPLQNSGVNAANLPLTDSTTLSWAGNQTTTRSLTPTLGLGSNAEYANGIVKRHVKFTYAVNSGAFTVSGTCRIYRTDPATGAQVDLLTDNAGALDGFTGTWEFDYETGTSLADETFSVFYTGDADAFNFTWTITEYEVTANITGGSGDPSSTAAAVIGQVTCDVEGIQDDAAGTISGTPGLLLENPGDVVKLALVDFWPGVLASDFGATFAAARASLAAAGYKWAFLLDGGTFSEWRRRFGEQARSILYLERGVWEFKYLVDAPAAQLTLDYNVDVDETLPATIARTARTDVRTRLHVSSQRDYVRETYRRVKTVEDLTQPGFAQAIEGKLELDLVQDVATADALGAYWLNRWKRQPFTVDLIACWNVLALDKVDYVSFINHPVLEGHGGAALVFRIVGKSYLLGDENPGRIRLHLVEAT